MVFKWPNWNHPAEIDYGVAGFTKGTHLADPSLKPIRAQGTPTPSNLDKMLLVSLANRVTRHQAPRFGITSTTRKHNGVTGHV
jgi:hypothetical protein